MIFTFFSLRGRLHIQKLFTLHSKKLHNEDFLSKIGAINEEMRVSFFYYVSNPIVLVQKKPGCIDAQLYEQVTDNPISAVYLETEIWEDERAMLDSFIDDLYEDLHHEMSDFYTLKSNWYYINGTKPK